MKGADKISSDQLFYISGSSANIASKTPNSRLCSRSYTLHHVYHTTYHSDLLTFSKPPP